MENLHYQNENIEREYLKNMRRNQFLKIKNSFLELEKDFIELKDRELKDIEEKDIEVKREIQKQFLKLIFVHIDDMDKFEQKEMKKIRPIKNMI